MYVTGIRSSHYVFVSDAGITAQQFVERPKVGSATNSYGQSHYDILRSLIAKKLDTPVGNVDIFTVRDHPTMTDTVDVRYSAHGSPYYRPSRIDGLMNEDKKEVCNNRLTVILKCN